MLEWWEAALLSIATALTGGLIGIVTAYFAHRWATSASRATEDRRAEREKERVEWETRLQYRRDRLRPILESLEIAKRHLAGVAARDSSKMLYEQNVANIQGHLTEEEWLQGVARTHPAPSIIDVVSAFRIAMATDAPSEIRVSLRDVLAKLSPEQSKDGSASAYSAIRAAERAIEDYLVLRTD